MNKQIMVLTWLDDTGMRETGKIIQRNGVLVQQFERCQVAKAVIWSSNSDDFDKGKAYAIKEGYRVHIMPADTKDILGVARQIALDHALGNAPD